MCLLFLEHVKGAGFDGSGRISLSICISQNTEVFNYSPVCLNVITTIPPFCPLLACAPPTTMPSWSTLWSQWQAHLSSPYYRAKAMFASANQTTACCCCFFLTLFQPLVHGRELIWNGAMVCEREVD